VHINSITPFIIESLMDITPKLKELHIDASMFHEQENSWLGAGDLLPQLLSMSTAAETLQVAYLPFRLPSQVVQSLTGMPCLRNLIITMKHGGTAIHAVTPHATSFQRLETLTIHHTSSIEVSNFLNLICHNELKSLTVFVSDETREIRATAGILDDIIPSIVRFLGLHTMELVIQESVFVAADEEMQWAPVGSTALQRLAVLNDLRTFSLKWRSRGPLCMSNASLARLATSWPRLRSLTLPAVSEMRHDDSDDNEDLALPVHATLANQGKLLGPACLLDLANLCPELTSFTCFINFSDSSFRYGPVSPLVKRLCRLESLDVGESILGLGDEAEVALFLAEMCPKLDNVRTTPRLDQGRPNISWLRVSTGIKVVRMMARYQAELSAVGMSSTLPEAKTG
jgi:hypothetical protein